MAKYKDVATVLATYIVQNWNFCPIDESVTIKECDGFHRKKCVECIMKNTDGLYVYPYFDGEENK